MLQLVKLNPSYLHFHTYTLIPDEIFFHTLIVEVNKNSLGNLHQTLTYVNWEKPGVPLPVTFSKNDYHELINLPHSVLFARKFDTKKDADILNMLDLYAD